MSRSSPSVFTPTERGERPLIIDELVEFLRNIQLGVEVRKITDHLEEFTEYASSY